MRIKFSNEEQSLIDSGKRLFGQVAKADGLAIRRRARLGRTLLKLKTVCRRGFWTASLATMGVPRSTAYRCMAMARLSDEALAAFKTMDDALEAVGYRTARVHRTSTLTQQQAISAAQRALRRAESLSAACAGMLPWITKHAGRPKKLAQ